MYETLSEIVPELLYAVLASALTLLGLFVENTGIQTLGSGDATMGLWMTAVGIVALYAGFKLAREKVVPGLRAA
mgnify:CR=1 FL=1